MFALRLFIITLALVAIWLCVGLVGVMRDIESIKITQFGLLACALMYLGAGCAFWVERQEEKEWRDKQNPPGQ